MFSLIISIIAVALVAVLALASMYYGGESLTQGTATANAARYLNEANQITAAANLYKLQNTNQTPTAQDLVDNDYLKALPQGNWYVNNGFVERPGISLEECTEVNRLVGYTGPTYACDDPALPDDHACCYVP